MRAEIVSSEPRMGALRAKTEDALRLLEGNGFFSLAVLPRLQAFVLSFYRIDFVDIVTPGTSRRAVIHGEGSLGIPGVFPLLYIYVYSRRV